MYGYTVITTKYATSLYGFSNNKNIRDTVSIQYFSLLQYKIIQLYLDLKKVSYSNVKYRVEEIIRNRTCHFRFTYIIFNRYYNMNAWSGISDTKSYSVLTKLDFLLFLIHKKMIKTGWRIDIMCRQQHSNCYGETIYH